MVARFATGCLGSSAPLFSSLCSQPQPALHSTKTLRIMSFAAFLIVLGVTVSATGQIFLKIGANSPSKLNTPDQLTGS